MKHVQLCNAILCLSVVETDSENLESETSNYPPTLSGISSAGTGNRETAISPQAR